MHVFIDILSTWDMALCRSINKIHLSSSDIKTDGKAQEGRAVIASRIGQLHALPSAHELQELDEIKVEGFRVEGLGIYTHT